MWADAQRDGRPADYKLRWHPLLNAVDQIAKIFAPGKTLSGGKPTSPGDGQTPCKVWLTSVERRHCSNEAKTRNPFKFADVPQTP